MTDPSSDTAMDDKAHALARVRSFLLDLGCSEEEIEQAVADDVIDLLMVDRVLVPAERRFTQGQVADRTGIALDVLRRIWRALGFLDVGEDEPAFTEMDIEAVELFQSMVAIGSIDVDSAIQMSRVIGSSMARIAEAETAPGSPPILVSSGDSVIDADEFARSAGASIPAMARLLEFVWRRHVQVATRRAMLIRSRGLEHGISPVLAVGFADMVGYTMLSQHLDDEELAAVVSRFEELAHDTVTGLGGRVVKMIGDEVMFVVQTASGAAQIGLSLAEAYAGDELLSDVRVALAVGPVLVQDGDFYGPVVNLASRLVNVASPGTVLVSDAFHAALEEEGEGAFDSRALRPRTLKNIGRVQVWKLSRAGTEPGSDRRRTMRWERLGDVLRELDDLRERGEQFMVQGSRSAHSRGPHAGVGDPDAAESDAGGSDTGEPDSGDAVSTEIEASVERGDQTTP